MLTLYTPELKDLWFKQQMLADEATMAYNRAWGGTIPFPEEKWPAWHEKWVSNTDGRHFYRYVKDESGAFVGEIACHFDEDVPGFMADVIIYAPFRGRGYGREGLEMLCAAAGENGVTTLYDEIAADNPSVKLFLKCGFTVVRRTETGILLKKELEKPAGMDFEIKKMETDAEIKGKAYVVWQSWREAYRGLIDQSYLDRLSLEQCENTARRWPDKTFVAKDGDRVIGFSAYGDYRGDDLEGAGEVIAIYVLKEYYGTGAGRLLMDKALAALDQKKVALWVLNGNGRDIRFYEKCGFRFDEKEKTQLIGTPVTELRMVLER
ncbi:MAG: GNAT family N-acetyltransferase [Clostridia bacterium]|nr:GNAT family N-acetyltransferase [Clostridia bacterium]